MHSPVHVLLGLGTASGMGSRAKLALNLSSGPTPEGGREEGRGW